MKHTIDPNISTQTELTQLRALLDEAERRIVVMQQTPTGAHDVIVAVDEIDRLLAAAKAARLDVRAEEGRADFLRRRLAGGAPGVVRLVQAADLSGKLVGSPTWQLVEAAQIDYSRKRVRRLLLIGLPLLALMLTIIVLTLLFPPPPQANLNGTRSLAQTGKLDQALLAAQAEATRVPTDPQAALWIGALHTAKGDQAAADAAWQTARTLLDDDQRFYFDRGNTLLEAGLPDPAEQDARTLIADSATEAPGYLLLGGVEETRGRIPEASAAFQRAADLARAAGNSQLEVIAKTRLGLLLQSGAGAIPPTPTP